MGQISYGTITITDTNDIESIVVEYAQNQSSTTAPTSGWSTTRPTWQQGYYIWQRTRTHKTETETTADIIGTAVCITGSTGSSGTSVTISSIKYAVSTTESQPADSSFTYTTVPTVAEGSWLWTLVTYSNGSKAYTKSKQGVSGDSITVSKVEYQSGTSSTSAPTGTWQTSIPTVAEGNYLWTKTTYSDGNYTYSVAKQGKSGTSVSISNTSTTYQVSTSPTTTPTGEWKTTVQSTTTGQYLWTRTIVTYSDGNSTTSYSVAAHGATGTSISISSIKYAVSSTDSQPADSSFTYTSVPTVNEGQWLWTLTTYSNGSKMYTKSKQGKSGDAGQSLTATKTQYTHVASNVTITTSNHTSYTWTDNVPEYDSAKPVYWGRITNTYSNPAKTEYLVYKDNGITDAMATAAEANETAASAEEKAIQAESIAVNVVEDAQGALSIARATEQHFWFNPTTSGALEAGAYITDTAIDTFKSGKAGGYLLARSDGLELGKASNKFMTLSATALNFYRPGTTTIDASLTSSGLVLTKGGIKFGTAGQSGFVYLSTDDYGSSLTINGQAATDWKQVIGTKFGVRADGTVYASGVSIAGTISATGGTIGGFKIDSTSIRTNDVAITSNADNSIGLSSADFTRTINGTSRAGLRFAIGDKFGVTGDGALYASSANLRSATVEGAITATSLTIGSGSDAYDGISAVNISGYIIEIIDNINSVPSGTTVSNGSTYLYPVMYHNGIPVDEGITNTNYIWYRDNDTIGTTGDSTNGGIVAEYNHSYRVTYSFADGEVSQAGAAQTILVDPQKYITRIDDTGITIHPEVWTNESSYVQLDGTGMKLYNSNGIPIAQYGTITIVGATSGKHVYIDENGIQLKNASTVLANFSSSVRVGPESSGHILINSGGIDLNAYSGSNIINMAHIGYATTTTESGTGQYPYFTFGTRRNDITEIGGYSFTAGSNNSAARWGDITLGSNNKNYGNVVIGSGNTADFLIDNPYASDNSSSTNHWSSCYILGYNNVGAGGFIIGVGNKSYRRYNVTQGIALGHYNIVAYNGIAIGQGNTSDGYQTAAIGYYNQAHGYYSVAMGQYSQTNSTSEFAMGNHAYANAWSGSMAIGDYNTIRTSGTGYSFCIGNGYEDERSNCFEVQNNGTVYATAYNYLSDERIKTNFKDVSTLKQILMELEPIDYEWTKITHKGSKNVYDDKKRHIGLKAQHTLSVFEKYGYKNYGIVEEHDDYYSINYSEIIPMCVKVIQEQEERIDSLENEIKQIKLLLAEGK